MKEKFNIQKNTKGRIKTYKKVNFKKKSLRVVNNLCSLFNVNEKVFLKGQDGKLKVEISSIIFNGKYSPNYNVSVLHPFDNSYIGHINFVQECYLSRK